MTHAPPYRALEAFHIGRLRPSHRAIVEHHLVLCEACRVALAAVGAYERISGEARSFEPHIDWARIESKVARRIGRKQRDKRIALFAGSVVAIAAATVLATLPRAEVRQVASSPEVPVEATDSHVVAHTSGDVVVDEARIESHTASPRALRDGSTLRTRQGTAHVQIASGTSFELGPDAELTLASMHAPTRLVLAAGRISNEVRPGTHYEVVAGPYVVRVRGTRFDVERNGEHVAVHLHAGRVEVIENGASLGILVAPATWTSPDAAAPAAPERIARPRVVAADVAPEPVPTVVPAPISDETDIAESVRSQSGLLRHCIAEDAQRVSFTIHFSVGAMGNIRDVSLSSRSEVPTEVSDCVLRTVQRMRVPAPDDPLDLSLPMSLP